ncbi:MAG: TGS domain-containing protein [Nanoarchaeota archaeon]
MPINPDFEYGEAVKEYEQAQNDEEKLAALKNMLSKSPSHKGAEVLRADIKNKISKLKQKLVKQKKSSKKSSRLAIKKEGSATICLVGTQNSGKSNLLKKLTKAKTIPGIYKPHQGIYDYYGIKLQIIEIPPIKENFDNTELGPSLLAIIRLANLIILFFNDPKEKDMLTRELEKSEIKKPTMIYNNQENIGDEIWKRLPLVKVQTKQPGKKPDYPPIALKKDSTIKNLAEHVHKDFLKQFKYAKVWGSSKFPGQMLGLNHKLKDNDIVEFHLK